MIHPNVKLLRATGMMIGAIIGAGVFGLPYAFAQSGVAIGLLWLTVVGFVILILQLMLGEVVIQTPGRHRLVGLVERYVGPSWRWIALAALASGVWGAMLAYMLVGGRFLHVLFEPMIGGPEWLYSLLVWALPAYMIYRGLQSAARIEVFVVVALLFLFTFIILLSLPQVELASLQSFNLSQAFVPYGVILFASAGIGIVPEMADVLGRRKKQDLARAIVIGMGTILIIYALFSVTVVGVTGQATSQMAFDGLIPVLGPTFAIISSILGSVTILSIYMVLGIEVLNTLKFDFRLTHKLAWIITITVPLLLYLVGFREFINVLGFVGGVLGSFLGILIALTYWNMKRSPVCKGQHCIQFPAVLTWAIIILFGSGLIIQISSFF